MAIIPQRDRETLTTRLEAELKEDVTIKLFTQKQGQLVIPGRECSYCGETQELLEELTSLSPKLHLEVYDFYSERDKAGAHGVQRIPAIVMGSNGNNNVKFYGMPMGNEFGTILEDMLALSQGVSPLKQDTLNKLKEVDRDVLIQVFVTPTWPHCPQVARVAHAMAIENPNIKADVVEVQEFPDIARLYQITGVPKTVINDSIQFLGSVPEEYFVNMVLQAVGKKPQEDKTGDV